MALIRPETFLKDILAINTSLEAALILAPSVNHRNPHLLNVRLSECIERFRPIIAMLKEEEYEV